MASLALFFFLLLGVSLIIYTLAVSESCMGHHSRISFFSLLLFFFCYFNCRKHFFGGFCFVVPFLSDGLSRVCRIIFARTFLFLFTGVHVVQWRTNGMSVKLLHVIGKCNKKIFCLGIFFFEIPATRPRVSSSLSTPLFLFLMKSYNPQHFVNKLRRICLNYSAVVIVWPSPFNSFDFCFFFPLFYIKKLFFELPKKEEPWPFRSLIYFFRIPMQWRQHKTEEEFFNI